MVGKMRCCEVLGQITQINAQLLQAAEAGRWHCLKVLEVKRRKLIRQCLDRSCPDPELFQYIQAIVQTDREIIRLRLRSLRNPPVYVKCGGE